jgi:hypothetical protein
MAAAARLQRIASKARKPHNGEEEPATVEFRKEVEQEAEKLVESAQRLKRAADIYARRQNARRS